MHRTFRPRRAWLLTTAIASSVIIAVSCANGGSDSATSRSSVSTAAPADTTPTGSMPSTAPPTTQATLLPQDFSSRGPFQVGATRLQLPSGAPVEVFYPADSAALPADAVGFGYTPADQWGADFAAAFPDLGVTIEVPDTWVDVLAADGANFPLVVLSHGRGGTRFSSSMHAAHLASWGFVVAAPQHPSRDLIARLSGLDSGISDVTAVIAAIDLLVAESARPGSLIEGVVNGELVAVEGHSAGGRDAALAAYTPEVDTWIGLSPAVPVPDDAAGGHDVVNEGNDGFDQAGGEFDPSAYFASVAPPNRPSMMIVADNDVVYPVADRVTVYDWLPAPKRFVVLADTGHVVYYDACSTIQETGGLGELADTIGLARSSLEIRLSEDGCMPTDAPAGAVQATWNHLVVAQLRWVFDIDRDVAALSLEHGYLDTTFPGRIAEYLVEP